ncbi:MAG TPA: RluA family pseudouridine synthase [Nitrospirota bacterium]|nr:RluA family pseudouridine synthase [Nitrospirota bacterium]
MHKRFTARKTFLPHGLVLLFEDKDILVVNKPEGLLTVATATERFRTAHCILTDYIRKGCGRCHKRLFIVHRLDRDTSGTLIFAKSEEAMLRLKESWKQTEKKYLAIVHGKLDKRSDTISSFLEEDKTYTVHSTKDSTRGKLSQTTYTVIKEKKDFSLLEVVLITGRKNQIRVHLADIGHPVVGDAKYGKTDKVYKRLALHAWSITFKHPISGQQLAFEAAVPVFFTAFMGHIDMEINPPRARHTTITLRANQHLTPSAGKA